MATRANSLTERVTKPASAAVHMWSMPANDVRTFVSGLGSLGYDRGVLLASAGLGDPELNDPDARIPCEALGAMLSCAQHKRFTPNIGLELARITPPARLHCSTTCGHIGHRRTGVGQLTLLAAHWQSVVLEVHDEGSDGIRVQMGSGAALFSFNLASLMIPPPESRMVASPSRASVFSTHLMTSSDSNASSAAQSGQPRRGMV
jgi:hypothetical protein